MNFRLPSLLLAAAIIAVFPAYAASINASGGTASEKSVEELTASVRGSIAVLTQQGRNGNGAGVGSGFVISRDGLIATCLHVIGEGRPIRVVFASGKEFPVIEIFASDRKLDLAILRIAATNLSPLKLGNDETLAQGAAVVAFGNPLGLEHSVVSGTVSARRELQGNNMIQLAMPIEAGNSGGPLVDMRGRVHGILSLKHALSPNLGFAMPVSALKSLMDKPNPVPIAKWIRLASLDPREWTPSMGAQWRRKAGAVYVDGIGSGFGGRSVCLSKHHAPAVPYEVSVSVKLDDESGAAGLVFGGADEQKHYGFYPTGGQLRLTRFDGPSVYSWNILQDVKVPEYRASDWNVLKVRVETNRIVAFVNDAQVLISQDTAMRGDVVGLAKFRQTAAGFRDFRVSSVGTRNSIPESADSIAAAARSRERLLEKAHALDMEAAALRRKAESMHARTVEAELVRLLSKDNPTNLFSAALLVARLDMPELDPAPYQSEVARMVEEIERALPAKSDDTTRLDALTKYLFVESGFHGSRTDYYNRANSYLNDVIDDREGLPISLSVLYLELARRLKIEHISGIPLPTRFMVKHAPPGAPARIIDVFDGGKILTRSQAVELIADDVDAVTDEDFEGASPRAIIVRMLHNLLGIAEKADALRYLDVIVALTPDSAPDRFARARARLQAGDTPGAKEDLRWILDHELPGIDLERVRDVYRGL